MQLVAYGAQDIYLTGNPQITFFKVVYRRHTNFSMECIQQSFNGSMAISDSSLTAIISRNGDLISNMHLDVLFPANTNVLNPNIAVGVGSTDYLNYVNNTGHALIDFVELEIGGQKIDKHYGHWLDVWNELCDHDQSENLMINKHESRDNVQNIGPSNDLTALQLYVPLKFWFNRNPGLALPLIALQYHEVKLKLATRNINTLINFRRAAGAATISVTTPPSVNLWVDYIYLDTDERRRFAQQSHEYLIEQLQYQNSTMSNSIKLNLNHPVKELIWTVQDARVITSHTGATSDADPTANVPGAAFGAAVSLQDGHDWFNYMANQGNEEVIGGSTSNEHFDTFKLLLNGHDRFTERKASYFRNIQPLQAGHRLSLKHVYNYSFAIKPEEHQPSGTCNFSRIDNGRMTFTNAVTDENETINIYAVNYNVLRIMSGMGGLAYSN